MEETLPLRERASLDSSLGDSVGEDLTVSEPGDEETMDYSRQTHQASLGFQYRLILYGVITILMIFGGGSILTWFFSKPLPPALFTDMGPCGSTPEEAKQNGCVFDLMMSGWVHTPCYDKELSDRFLRENNWTFYREREGVNVIPEEEARLGDYHQIFTLGNFHYQHCSYIWAKQLQAQQRVPFVLDSASRSEEHSDHCIQRVGNPDAARVTNATGTKITKSTWKIRCMIGHGYVP